MAKRPTHHKGYGRGGPGEESDYLGCGHCTAAIEIQKPGQASTPADFCRCCTRFICQPCETKRLQFGCVVWERMIATMENKTHAKSTLMHELGIEE